MTTLEILRQEGRAEGKVEEARFSNIKRDVEIILNSLVKTPDMPIDTLSIILGKPKVFIQKIQKGFIGGNEQKARKIMVEVFKDFKALDDFDKKRLEQLLNDFLPKFKGKKEA